MAKHLCVDYFLLVAVLFYFQVIIQVRNFDWAFTIDSFLFIVPLFLQVEEWPRLYVG